MIETARSSETSEKILNREYGGTASPLKIGTNLLSYTVQQATRPYHLDINACHKTASVCSDSSEGNWGQSIDSQERTFCARSA
jgi:hypothetical protein